MSALKAVNMTKYENGGSGDYCIEAGYIKSVEKVWIDSYAFTSALDTDDSICIGILPADARLTDVTVFMPSLYALDTTATVYLQTGATWGISGYFGAMRADGWGSDAYTIGTAATLRLASGFKGRTFEAAQKLYITVQTSDKNITTVASGTIRSIIKYT